MKTIPVYYRELQKLREQQLPILPRSGLWLYAYESARGVDGLRFARLFAEVWRSLSAYVRRRLKRHWQEFSSELDFGEPMILLGDPLIVSEGRTVFGIAVNGGAQLLFDHEALRRAPDSVVKCVIAHELAHAFLMARRDPSHEVRGAEEIGACTTATSWGYPDKIIEKWQKTDKAWIEAQHAARQKDAGK